MEQYPEVVQQLHSAALDQGLSTYTVVYGLAEVVNGLKEATDSQIRSFSIYS